MRILSTIYCDQTLLAHIGSIAAESAYLERYIETVLYGLTKMTREVGHVVIERTMFDGKVDLLNQIGKTKLKARPKKLARFTEIISDIKASNSERVIAVHGVWLPQSPNLTMGIIDALRQPKRPIATKRGKLDKPDTTLTSERAEKVAESIYQAHLALHDFVDEVWPKLTEQVRERGKQRPGRKRPGSRKDATPPSSPQ